MLINVMRNMRKGIGAHLQCHQPQIEIRRFKISNVPTSSKEYCLNLVKQNDYENFLPTLLIRGPSQRQCTMAVRAFNVEIAKIAGAVSDQRLARIRLQFWYDALERIYDKSRNKALPDHPVIRELHYAVVTYSLPKQYLTRLIKARERVTNAMFPTTKELEQYVEDSNSSLYYLILKIGGIANVNADHAASHLGKAQGICNILRAFPLYPLNERSARAIPIVTQQILLQHGVSYERLVRQHNDDKIVHECIFDVASLANTHLTKARALAKSLESSYKQYMLPAVAIGRYLERLRRCDFNLSHSKLSQRDGFLPIALYWNYFRKTY